MDLAIDCHYLTVGANLPYKLGLHIKSHPRVTLFNVG